MSEAQPQPSHREEEPPTKLDGRPASSPDDPPPDRLQRGIRGLFQHVKAIGSDIASISRGRPNEMASEADDLPASSAASEEKTDRKVSMLHTAAERLRGVADTYIAAKLDEIEARVDAKLDHVEQRIDEKIVELHRQLREIRDRELRHRLRLLKVTLVFTVLVAALSLVYKWLAKYLAG